MTDTPSGKDSKTTGSEDGLERLGNIARTEVASEGDAAQQASSTSEVSLASTEPERAEPARGRVAPASPTAINPMRTPSDDEFFESQTDDALTNLIMTVKRPAIGDLKSAGGVVVLLFFGFLIGWSVLAPLSTGAVVQGRVAVEGDRTVVEYFEGGIVSAIHVKSGEPVRAGMPLIDFRDDDTAARLRDLGTRRLDLEAQHVRLLAEWSDTESLDFSGLNTEGVPQPIADQIFRLEAEKFRERQGLYSEQRTALSDSVTARRNVLESVIGMDAQMARQLALIDEEIADVELLLEKGLAPKTRALALLRQRERLLIEQVNHESQTITERDNYQDAVLRLSQLDAERRGEIADELKTTRVEIEALNAQIVVFDQQLARTRITSPYDGIVMNMQVGSVGEVVEAGGALLDVVPADARLVVTGRLMAQDGANIIPGLQAKLMVQAFKGRNAPQLDGEVLKVSPDVLTDPQTGETYYDVQIGFSEPSIASLSSEHQLQPGFPVQAIVETAAQPVIAYLLGPILGTMDRAFVEP